MFICPEVNNKFVDLARARLALPVPESRDQIQPYSAALIYDAVFMASSFRVSPQSAAASSAFNATVQEPLSRKDAAAIQVCSLPSQRTGPARLHYAI